LRITISKILLNPPPSPSKTNDQMNLKRILSKLVATANQKAPTELTKSENYNIELLEQRIMYSATQLGGALGADGIDVDQFTNLCVDHTGIQEIFNQFDNDIDSGQMDQLIGDLLDQDGIGREVETAIFSGNSSDYEINQISQSRFEVSGPDGVEIINRVDRFQFADGKFEVLAGDTGNLDTAASSDDVGSAPERVDVQGIIETGGLGDDVVTESAGNDFVVDGFDNNLLAGDSGNDSLLGTDGNDILQGGDGNDRLVGGDSGDIFDGGRGHDTAVFNSSFDSFTFELVNGALEVTGATGTDTVMQNVEMLEFTDRTVQVSDLVSEVRAAAQKFELPLQLLLLKLLLLKLLLLKPLLSKLQLLKLQLLKLLLSKFRLSKFQLLKLLLSKFRLSRPRLLKPLLLTSYL